MWSFGCSLHQLGGWPGRHNVRPGRWQIIGRPPCSPSNPRHVRDLHGQRPASVESQDVAKSFLTVTEAMERAEVGPSCIAQWCIRYGIGRKIAGRWRVNPDLLARLLAGEREAA